MTSIGSKINHIGRSLICKFADAGFMNWMSDEMYIRLMYRVRMGEWVSLRDPKTFNEKIQWLKIHDRDPLQRIIVDKYTAKQWVSEQIGEQYVIPTLGVWNSFDEIDFDLLPDRFVLKCTHDSGGLVICRSKRSFDVNSARKKIERSLKRNYYYHGREWPYKDIRPRVLAEELLDIEETGKSEDTSWNSAELQSTPEDYKFFCFDGKVKALFVATGRGSGDTRFDFYDAGFNHLPVVNGHPNATVPPRRPNGFSEMVKLAEVLSVGFPHVRVDFYDVKGAVYFGEMTFYHFSGLVPFEPHQYDELFGSWIGLPKPGRSSEVHA